MSLIALEERADLAGAQAAPVQAPRIAAPALAPALRGAVLALLVPAILVAAWQGASALGWFAPNLLPSPSAIFAELADLWRSGDLETHLLVTFWRVLSGFFFGALAATVLGALTGASSLARSLLDPTLQALKAVPSLAWVPLFILWFGIFEASKVTLIAVGVFFPIYLNLMTGIQGVDRKLVEVGRVLNLSPFAVVRRILVPATLPSYFVGLRAGLALGWMFVIAAELMGASEGLGFLMVDGQMTGRPAIILGSLLLFAVAGKASDALLAALGNRLLAWQDGFGGMAKGARP